MKVLFAVQDEQISTKIVKEYQRRYKEIISYKNIYYFSAIIKELQRNKTYDRIVIDEELEEFSSNNYNQRDKFIFDKLDYTMEITKEDFYGKFNFTNLLPGMQNLGGNIDATLSNGIIYKLQEAADNQKVLGIAYQPFVIMSRMERAGSFKMGKILKDTPFDIMSASAAFKNGNMTVNNYYVDGSVISAAIGGNVDWVKENFNLDIVTMFKNTSKRGALAENLTDESGDPALAFVTYGKMSKPKLEMKSPKKVGKQIQAARSKEQEQFEEIKKFKE